MGMEKKLKMKTFKIFKVGQLLSKYWKSGMTAGSLAQSGDI